MMFSEEDLELILRALAHYTPAISTDSTVQERIGEAYEDEDGNVAVEPWMLADEVYRAGNIARDIMQQWMPTGGTE